jgi:hypothetical protein
MSETKANAILESIRKPDKTGKKSDDEAAA